MLAASSAATCAMETAAARGVQGDGASDAVERARHAAKAVLRSQRSPCVAATSAMRNACPGRRTWRGCCMLSFEGVENVGFDDG
jgi:hypothetical protein